MESEYIKMFNTNELNRLQRCAKNKDKNEIRKWGEDFERRISEYYFKRYKNYYIEEYKQRFKEVNIALAYLLHFSDYTRFGNKRLDNFFKDLQATMEGFYKEKFSIEEYKKMLIDDGIKIEEVNK